MNSQIQFFMTKDDEIEFMNEFKDSDYDILNEESYPIQIFYCCGEEHVQFRPSRRFDKILRMGSFGIRTKSQSEDSKRCEKLYKKMRKWIKDNYINNLVVFNTKTMKREDAKPVSSGGIWLNPKIQNFLKENHIVLKQCKNAFTEFYIKK